MVYNPLEEDPRTVDADDDAARKRMVRETEIDDIRWLMSSRRGRRIVWRLLDLSGPFRLSFDPNAIKMAFNEGNRNLGNQIFAEVMSICPEQYPVMVAEQKDGKRDSSGGKSK